MYDTVSLLTCTPSKRPDLASFFLVQELAECTNTDGSFTCSCNAGYAGAGTTCGNKNECASDDDNSCHVSAILVTNAFDVTLELTLSSVPGTCRLHRHGRQL